ncbi:MAG: FMN-dependent NADH-azoreductase [Deltaproteobacteria bacterium]|nr:FMN-dependent NADH-azoreductase [Deltaproteobacteria bacterium]NIS76327.1 FMN-dependent NADH-azoreductase [Deltaproteobacteria bacterium]
MKLLHIQGSPMSERSFSARVAEAFLEEYAREQPGDTIERLDIWQEDLQAFDRTAASGRYKVFRGQPHGDEEARAWEAVRQRAEEFKSADKLVVSSPMWNFSIPYRLKQYLDIIVQPGLTFSFTPEEGFKGLVTGKPLLLILARGGEYQEGTHAATFDYQRYYLDLIFRFIGFEYIKEIIFVEPTLAGGKQVAEQRLKEAIEKARAQARNF